MAAVSALAAVCVCTVFRPRAPPRPSPDYTEKELAELQHARNCSWRDWARGRWEVQHATRAFYSDDKRRNALRFCALHGDTRSHDRYVWHSDKCGVPAFNTKLLSKCLQNQRIEFVGDSHYYQAGLSFQARCETQQACSFSVESTKSSLLVRSHEAINQVSPELKRAAKRASVLVLGVSHHFAEGKHRSLGLRGMEALAMQAVRTVLKFLQRYRGLVVWVGYTTRYFFGGDWNEGGSCNVPDTPLPPSKLESVLNATVRAERRYLNFWNKVVLDYVAMHSPPHLEFLDVAHMSLLRPGSHVAKYSELKGSDCSHYCVPGVPDVWNEVLVNLLLHHPFLCGHVSSVDEDHFTDAGVDAGAGAPGNPPAKQPRPAGRKSAVKPAAKKSA
eukprot:Hpha_TRINITY_DN9095_c0_g1::TRINITY_DN9095_c0_g1_i1::g.141884::m.141884